jgi:hypothetical protein
MEWLDIPEEIVSAGPVLPSSSAGSITVHGLVVDRGLLHP